MNRHPQRVLRATLSDSPGGLTNVVQVFSSLSLSIDRLDYQRPCETAQAAAVVIYLRMEDRMIDLALRKLGRLVDVLSAHEITLVAEADYDETDRPLVVTAVGGERDQTVIHSA